MFDLLLFVFIERYFLLSIFKISTFSFFITYIILITIFTNLLLILLFLFFIIFIRILYFLINAMKINLPILTTKAKSIIVE